MRKYILVSLLSILSYSTVSFAQKSNDGSRPVVVYYTGQDFLNLNKNYPNEQLDKLYVIGLSDASNWISKDEWVVECTYGKKTDQLAAIFHKWLKDNPEQWHKPAAYLYIQSLKEACGVK